MRLINVSAWSSCFILLIVAGAMSQTAPKSSTQPTSPAPSANTPGPDRTTATFGDWVLQCDRRVGTAPPQRLCELAQTIQRPGDASPQAQIALGRILATDPIRLTALLPTSIAFETKPKVVTEGRDSLSVELTWVRCVPTGCFANSTVADDVIRKLRSQKNAGRLEYRDGTGRDVALPVSFRGFNEAFAAFIRENSN